MNTGALSLFHNVLTYNGEIIEYWKTKSTKKSKLNIKEKFGHALGIIGKPSMTRFNWDNFSRCVSDIEFLIIWSLEIQFLFGN
jgi:hypothetical protein